MQILMEEVRSPVENMKDQAEEVIEQVAASPWMEFLARFGYATKGIVYIVIGALAILAAMGWGGETTDARGALQAIETKPFGRTALATVAFGLIGYVLWRWVQALADTEHKGKELKGVLVRIGYFFSGAVYAGLAFTAGKVLIDVDEPDSSSEIQQYWIARLMEMPAGRWLSGLIGASVIGFGIYQIYKGFKAKFRKRLKLGEMTEEKDTWATWAGRIGYWARGVVFCIVGGFLIQAAVHYNPAEAKGLDGVFHVLYSNPLGAPALGVVAAGLIAYGFYMLVEARYRIIAGS
jgi:hypothetical protein